MSDYEGYGVDLSKVHWKQDAWASAFENIVSKSDTYKNDYEQYCQDYNVEPDDAGSKEDYIEGFEDNNNYASGIEALLLDALNQDDRVKKAPVQFIYDDYCIFVTASVPQNEAARANMLTQEEIVSLLATYLNPYITEPVTVEWLTIYNN